MGRVHFDLAYSQRINQAGGNQENLGSCGAVQARPSAQIYLNSPFFPCRSWRTQSLEGIGPKFSCVEGGRSEGSCAVQS